MDCKEHLLHFFLSTEISLSHYDSNFITSLYNMAHTHNRITTNQAALFDTLIGKYARQLSKAGLVVAQLKELLWKTPIIESSPELTGAKVSLIDDTLLLRVAYNKKFISDFRDVDDNPFQWNREEKVYKATFSTYGLKIIVSLIDNYFSNVSYCPVVTNLLNQLDKFNTIAIWTPTLVKINGNLYVAGCNDIIGALIKDVDLKLDIHTLYTLSQYGITIDSTLVEHDPKLKFAAECITEIDLSDIGIAAEWINELGCNQVLMGKGIQSLIKRASYEFSPLFNVSIFDKLNIELSNVDTRTTSNSLPILIQYNSHRLQLT